MLASPLVSTTQQIRRTSVLDRLETLGEYRYNWSIGETLRLGSARWLDAAGNRARVAGLFSGSGDIYAWRADVAGPA